MCLLQVQCLAQVSTMHMACDGLSRGPIAPFPACSLWPPTAWVEHMVSPSTGHSYGCALNPTASMGGEKLVNSYSRPFLVGSSPQFLQKQRLSLLWQPLRQV